MKKFIFVIVLAIGIALDISLAFILNPAWPIAGQAQLAIYVVAKVLFGMGLVFATLYPLFKKENATGMTFLLVGVSVLFQLLPLLFRGLYQNLPNDLAWTSSILCVAAIVYIALAYGLTHSNEKMIKANEKAEGKTIDIHEEK